MTARLARFVDQRGWLSSYPVQIAALLAAAVALFAAAQLLNTPNSADGQYGQLLAAIAIVVAFARVLGAVAQRLGQPRVMGEILAGILLGPTLIGLIPKFVPGLCPPPGAETACSWPFSAQTQDGLHAAAEIGLAFYMFMVGLELDPAVVRQRAREAATISLTSIVVPFTLGVGAALILLRVQVPGVYGDAANQTPFQYGDTTRTVAFVLFTGVAMSITAFPVLARILVEKRMIRGPIGSLALACAAIDDVVAWSLLALATVFAAKPGATAANPVAILLLALAFCLAMAFVARPVMTRVAVAYDEAGSLSGGWIVALFVGILVAAYAAQQAGIAVIFGAFVFGLCMPRRSGLTDAITSRVEDFVGIVLLPLFFVYSGLHVNITSNLTDPSFWAWTAVLIVIAVGGKWIGATAAARAVGIDRRSSLAIGALMNTRGLTELIVLNVGLGLGVISQELFSMLVLMALVTTFAAGPALRLIDRRGALAIQPEEEILGTGEKLVPTGAVLVACQDVKNLPSLVSIARALGEAGAQAREIVLVRILEPSPTGARWSRDREAVATARKQLEQQVELLSNAHFEARGVALLSPQLAKDLHRLARDERVGVVLTDGRRSLTASELPGGPVGELLREAESDVAVLVEREQAITMDATHAIVVPFGGSDHDWAAVELGARLADATGATLRLVGVASSEAELDVEENLNSAAAVVRSVSGVAVEPVVVGSGGALQLFAAKDVGLLVIGLSHRWREEGLGAVRREIAGQAAVPLLFVRRGSRSALIAPTGSFSEFGWSSVNLGPSASSSGTVRRADVPGTAPA